MRFNGKMIGFFTLGLSAMLLFVGCSSGGGHSHGSSRQSAAPSPVVSAVDTYTPPTAFPSPAATNGRTDGEFIDGLYSSKYMKEFLKLGSPSSLIDLAKTTCTSLRNGGDVAVIGEALQEQVSAAAGLIFIADAESTYCPDQLNE